MSVCVLIVWLCMRLDEVIREPRTQRYLVGLGLGVIALASLTNSVALTVFVSIVIAGAAFEQMLMFDALGPIWLCNFLTAYLWFSVILSYQYLYQENWQLVLVSILIAAGSDIGAMVAGRTWGRMRLPAWLSPNKTLEGVRDGTIFGTFVGMLALQWAISSQADPVNALVVAGFGACLAQTADLAGSYLKRQAGIDQGGSGMIFVLGNSCPRLGRLLEASGHGGFLDRCGSHAAVTLWLAGSHYFGLV